MQEPTVRHFYVKINNCFVHLVQYGHHESIIRSSNLYATEKDAALNSSLASSSSSTSSGLRNKPKKLIVFIPGNPGLLGVYHDFLTTLYKTLTRPSDPSEDPVILAIGHNNFDHPDCCDYRADERICIEDNELSFVEKPPLGGNQDPHQVEMQVVNKIVILRRLLTVNLQQSESDSCRLVFVGHSLGAYVTLRIIQDRVLAQAHAGSVLLHPALENLARTDQGAVIARYFNFKVDLLFSLLAQVAIKVIPKSVRLNLTKWYCTREFVESSSDIVIESLAQMVCPSTVTALIEMAKSELVTLKDFDHEKLIKPHVNKLKLIYTVGDHWVNSDHRLELREFYPELHIEEHQTLHAFVMEPKVVTTYAFKIGIFAQEFFG